MFTALRTRISAPPVVRIGPHRPFKVQGAPDAVDIAWITAEDQMGVFLERTDLGLRIRIGFSRPDNSLVGVQLNPPEFGAIFRTAGTAADMQILPERDRVDPRDLHGLGIVDGARESRGKRSASQSGEGSSAGVF
jgi:hypothetical protein